jgi:hypothetical protein
MLIDYVHFFIIHIQVNGNMCFLSFYGYFMYRQNYEVSIPVFRIILVSHKSPVALA